MMRYQFCAGKIPVGQPFGLAAVFCPVFALLAGIQRTALGSSRPAWRKQLKSDCWAT
jgi:hypothetical protein